VQPVEPGAKFDAKFDDATLGWDNEPDSTHLCQITLEAKRGETVVIAGPVGAGKSSIFGGRLTCLDSILTCLQINCLY